MSALRTITFVVTTALFAAPPAVAAGPSDDAPSIAELEAQRLRVIMHVIDMLGVNDDLAGAVAAYRTGLAIRPSGAELRAEYDALGAQLAARAVTEKLDADLLLGLLDDYEVWLSDSNTHPTTLWWLRSFVLRNEGHTGEADALVAAALAHQADSASYHLQVALYLVKNGFYEAAITEYNHGLPKATDDWVRGNYYIGLAFANVKLERYDQAVDNYEQVFKLLGQPAPNNNLNDIYSDGADACRDLGRYHELRGDLKQAIAANERALAFQPDELDDVTRPAFGSCVHKIGEAYLGLGDTDKAIEYLERAVDMLPEAPGVYSTLGDAYAKAGRDDDARDAYADCVRLYRDWIDKRPKSATPYNGLAWHYATHDEHLDEALELSKKSLELAPNRPELLDTLAEIYFRMGEHDEAIEWIQKALDLDPKPKHYLYYEQQLEKFEKGKASL